MPIVLCELSASSAIERILDKLDHELSGSTGCVVVASREERLYVKKIVGPYNQQIAEYTFKFVGWARVAVKTTLAPLMPVWSGKDEISHRAAVGKEVIIASVGTNEVYKTIPRLVAEAFDQY